LYAAAATVTWHGRAVRLGLPGPEGSNCKCQQHKQLLTHLYVLYCVAAATVTRRGRAVRLGLRGPEGALLRLHCADLDEERLWEVMSAMGLHDKVRNAAVSKKDILSVNS
jgi:hypothetical protein